MSYSWIELHTQNIIITDIFRKHTEKIDTQNKLCLN